LAKAKAKAQTIQCLNSMKQLQVCWVMYAGDNSDYLTLNWVGGSGYGHASPPSSWVGGDVATLPSGTNIADIQNSTLFQYNTSVGIYKCPPPRANLRPEQFFARAHRLNEFADGRRRHRRSRAIRRGGLQRFLRPQLSLFKKQRRFKTPRRWPL